ncbi:MAG TPA: futalosine hydrolase [Nitrospirae bacterium]|nr:futalosine hydrolase [Nitrospirota bacterium]
MKFLAFLSSMPLESDQILSRLKYVRSAVIAGKTVYKGKLQGIDVILLNSGIGKVNAAHSATCIVERFPVKGIINIGVGGAYPGSGLDIGDIAVASKEIYGDDGVVTSNGWESLKKIGIPLVRTGNRKYFNEFPIHKKLPSRLIKTARWDFKIISGNFLTVSATTGTHKRAVELEKRFNAVCENMEGAAIAHVCAIYKIPMLEIRGISNMAGVRDKRKWNLKLASENCRKVALKAITYSP